MTIADTIINSALTRNDRNAFYNLFLLQSQDLYIYTGGLLRCTVTTNYLIIHALHVWLRNHCAGFCPERSVESMAVFFIIEGYDFYLR